MPVGVGPTFSVSAQCSIAYLIHFRSNDSSDLLSKLFVVRVHRTPSPVKLKCPNLWPPIDLSKEENEATRYLHAVVHSIQYFAEGFSAAIELYRFSRSRPANVATQTVYKWRWFALNQGAMEIWHLREYLTLVPRKIALCATVGRHLNRDAQQQALDLFDKTHFPDFKLIRDGIAHQPIVSLSRKGYDIFLEDGSLASGRITDDHRYEVINRGKRYHFDMTDETLRKIIEVVTVYWTAFDPVVQEFDRLGRSDG